MNSRVCKVFGVAAIVAYVLLVSGCGSKLPLVQGIVTLDGEPVANATIRFESPDRAMATAKTNASGEYEAVTASQRGMAAGDYDVAISAYETADGGSESPIPVLRTPRKFNRTETSGLTAKIKEGRNEVDFELDSKGKK